MSISYSQLMIRCPCAGIVVETPEGTKVCRTVLLCATLDLPAKAAVTNTKQWNGEYGCSVCLDKGDNSSQSKNSRQWPYNPSPLLRTHEGMIRDARKSLEMKSAVSYKHFLV